MPIVTFRTSHIYDQTREQTGFVWQVGSSLAVREQPATGRKKIWSLQHIPSGLALDSIRPLWVRTKADLLWLCEQVDTNMPNEMALMRFIPFGGGADKMGGDLREAAMAVRRYALQLTR